MNLYPRRSLEAIALAKKGNDGLALEGLKFEGNKTIATNGHYMITTTYKAKPETPDYLSYPVKNAWDEREENPIIIGAEKIKQAIKILPSKKEINNLPILAKPLEGQYPNTDRVVPDYHTDDYTRVNLSPKLLKDIATLLAKDCETITLHISKKGTENKPIVILSQDTEFDNEVILMPKRLADK